jgi:hypothetical protein
MAPPRVQGPGLLGRVASGALAGRVSGGWRGARVGAAFALASTYPSQVLRAQIVERTPLPDIACAVSEDLLAAGLASAASTEPRPSASLSSDLAADGPETGQVGGFSAHRPSGWGGIVSGVVRGTAAAVVGTAAMTTAQRWVYGFTGDEDSEAPREVGERILGALGFRVPKERRPALGTAVHVLYGAGWGAPFGLAFRRGRPPGPARGVAFGAGVWLTSLVELPAFGVADPPWRQSPATLAQDLGFHLVYGAATAAAYEALAA